MPTRVEFSCPCCHAATLGRHGEEMVCPQCGKEFPIVRGIPILINDARSVFAIADYIGDDAYTGASYGGETDRASGLRAAYRRFAHRLSEFAIKRSHLDAETALGTWCSTAPSRPQVLVIGADAQRYAVPADITYTDVAFAAGIDVIADAHDLPFRNGSFDFVMAVAVLEHVADPQCVVAEIWRVLHPGGRVYAATPFMQPVHMGAYDFTRYTYLGHRRLFRSFDALDSGMALGPGAAAAWSLRLLLMSLSGSRRYQMAAHMLGLLIGIPLKLTDYVTRRHAVSLDGAAGTFFYGIRRDTPISDREMIGLYRGAQAD